MSLQSKDRGHRVSLLVFLLGVFALLGIGVEAEAGTNTEEALKLFNAGAYDAAERLFESELKKEGENGAAHLGLARVYERTGRYEEMLEELELAAKIEAFSSAAELEKLEHLVRIGEYKKARKGLESFLDSNDENLKGMMLLGELYYLLGEVNEGDRIMNLYGQVFNKGKAESAEDLTLVGMAMFNTEAYQDAEYAFSLAREADSKYIQAYLQSGNNFLEKYNQTDAEQMFDAVLEIDANHPLARVGIAHVLVNARRDYEGAKSEIAKALEVNPKLIEAHLLLAEISLYDEDIEGARASLDEVFAVNPKQLHALTLKAVAFYMADEVKEQEKAEKAVLAINPRYADLYVTMAEFGEVVHRYQEGILLYKKALDLDKSYWKAFVGLGIAYTRVGEDEKGQEYLTKGFEADPYNVRALNMVNLYEDTLKQFDFVERDELRFRFHRDEKEVLALYVPPLMEGVFALYEKKYGFTPPVPVSVEIFPDIQSFSVRSVGLPAIDPQGICFGKVITARSPSEGNFNWAQVLAHELAHTFHIALSDSRVPRWFTEGLAEYETIIARREWKREYDIELWLAMKSGRMLSVKNLNFGFTHAKTIDEVVVAYYQASKVLEYMDQTYGYEAIVGMLKGWAERKEDEEVFVSVLGIGMDEFDKGFREWLATQLAFLDGYFEFNPDYYITGAKAFLDAAEASPEDAEAQAHAGLAALFNGAGDEAKLFLDKAIELDPNNSRAVFLGGIIALREGDYEKALEYYQKLLELGEDGYLIQTEIAFLYKKTGKLDEAIEHYEKAKEIFPSGIDPYFHLVEIYASRNDDRNLRKELEELIYIDQNDFSAAYTLFSLVHEAGETNKARRYGEIALDINPFVSDLHLKLAEIGMEQEDWLFSEREFLAYLALEPGTPLEGYLGLAEVYIELGNKGLASDYIERAKATNPNEARISSVEAKLKK